MGLGNRRIRSKRTYKRANKFSSVNNILLRILNTFYRTLIQDEKVYLHWSQLLLLRDRPNPANYQEHENELHKTDQECLFGIFVNEAQTI